MAELLIGDDKVTHAAQVLGVVVVATAERCSDGHYVVQRRGAVPSALSDRQWQALRFRDAEGI